MRAAAFIGLLTAALAAGAASAGPTGLDYQITMKLEPERGALAAEVTISEPADEARNGTVFLLAKGYVVSKLTASKGASATVEPTNKPFPGLQAITLTAPPGVKGRVSATLSYAGPLAVTGGDDGVNAIQPDRVELSADAVWYPIEVGFSTRFTFDARVAGLTPAFVVASPDRVSRDGEVVSIRRLEPSQDIAFSASPSLKEAVRGDLRFYAADLSSENARNYQLYGERALTYFVRWFGPLPTGKAVVVVEHRKNGTGYSRPGYLVVADVGTLAADNVWGRVGYVAHELSHSWWSNAEFTTEDYWLVESTAEYVALRFLASELGQPAADTLFEGKKKRAERGGPILGQGRPSGDAVYAKGPLLLRELERRIGRDKLDAVLGALARRKHITTRDFLDELARVAGPATATEFEADLRR